ncbi:hypothetical protein CPB85DRAFT_1252646 [Mucidula mucida]|nr:hypothetical protein CPB85DRAFT_1252646 [Mucidula mucida]
MTSLMVSSVLGEDPFIEPAFDSTLDELLLSESITSSWDLTSNFACCGLILADLHALLEHFETTHGERRPPSLEIPAPPTPPASSCSLSDVLTPPAQALDTLSPLPVTPCRLRTIAAPVPRRERTEDKDKDRKRRKRKRQYPCTKTPGCVKEYLNKNGLKYHLEKGECVVPRASADR